MKDPGCADASSYFANLLVARLGIPFKRVRLYYTGEHPAVRRTPKPSSQVLSRANLGIANARIGDLIEELCDRAKDVRSCSSISVLPTNIDFEAAHPNLCLASAAPAPSACSFATAMSPRIGAMPELRR
jgi:hypothetical protein